MITVITYEEAPWVIKGSKLATGLVPDILQQMFERSGIKYRLSIRPAKRSLLMAERLPFHCIVPVERSQERESTYRWISPLVISRYGFFSMPMSSIQLDTLLDAKPYRIGSYLGSGIAEYLQPFGFKVELAPRNEMSAFKLLRGRVDLWASDIDAALYLIQDSSSELLGHKLIGIGKPKLVFFTTIRAMGCHREIPQQLTQKLQQSLNQMFLDGTVAKIYKKYGIER
ncbi:substrate-binding periplasmic protein [Dongshaea marina]|uniref:substrate-binding periplasmic protein n=1 Tax=Dongshaea marina TaxID=2047966 RepID=UPI00131ED29B|nr:ABC transporter substrate-binding protein [Dongshaea marina]